MASLRFTGLIEPFLLSQTGTSLLCLREFRSVSEIVDTLKNRDIRDNIKRVTRAGIVE
jgi:hypothetical protein